MERLHSISPESSSAAFGWRKTLKTRGSMLNREDKNNLLTSSLPSHVFSQEMEMRSPKNPIAFSLRKTLRTRGSMLNWENKNNQFTASLPTPVFSKEVEMRSPKNPIAFSLRKTLKSQGNLLASSLPSSVLSKMMDRKSPKNITSHFPLREVIEGVDYRHGYPIYEALPHRIIERPRSANIQLNPEELQVIKRKPLWNFTRVRPCSPKVGRIQLDDSSSELNAGTCEVDDAFSNIKAQLAQLSEEDVWLQERLECLTLEIASMQRRVNGKYFLPPAVAPTTTYLTHGQEEILMTPNLSSPRASLPMLSLSQSKIAEESWEAEEKDRGSSKKGGGGKGISNYRNLSNSARGSL